MSCIKPTPPSPSVAISIVNWNSYQDTKECLQSLKDIQYENLEVFVIDNDSSDESAQQLASEFSEHTFIFNDENAGFSGGHNVIIEQALHDEFDYILLLNNDTLVEPDFLSQLVATGERNDNTGIVGGLILEYPETSNVWYSGGKLSPVFGGSISQKMEDDVVDVSLVIGCMMLIKSDVFDDIGLLRENYFMYFEENEFCRRAAINGWDLKVNRQSRIYHKCGGSTDEGSVASPLKAYYITRNWILFVKNSSTNVERILGLLYMLSTRVIIFTYWLIFGGRDVAYAGLLGVKDGILNKDGKHPDYP